ncbi:DUF6338 family protein [Arthrobacter sp. H14]|uniref:DUF6338 family protein n=1 Tax=Arthrobacter sp. H14 TaxID=1312959 RepID=UPI0023B86B00|nr:DUF6338 family protein [Arthrobacter sp. H14]
MASAGSLVTVFITFYVVSFFSKQVRAGLQQFFTTPQKLLQDDSQLFFGTALISLLAAVGLGAFYGSATAYTGLGLTRRWIYRRLGITLVTMDRGLSAWSAAFEAKPDHYVHLGMQLKSGTWIQGKLYTYNQDGHDGPDRALTLSGGIYYRLAESDNVHELDGFSMAIVHASEIEFMTVGHEKR